MRSSGGALAVQGGDATCSVADCLEVDLLVGLSISLERSKSKYPQKAESIMT
jgi:hypothetical protein